MKTKFFAGVLAVASLLSVANADTSEIIELRNDLQSRGFNVEVREIRMKYFDPHCFGTYGYFQFNDNNDVEFDAVEMYGDHVTRYRNGLPQTMKIEDFSRMVKGDFFIQVTK